MKIYNVSDGKKYLSQRDNSLRPSFTCNVTSMVAALTYLGITLPVNEKFAQPEDALEDFMLNNTNVDAYYAKIEPSGYKQYIASGKDYKKTTPPNENHAVLSFGTNLWLGKNEGELTTFSTNVSVQDMLFGTTNGLPAVLSGVFNGLHHVVALVGFVTTQEEVINSVADLDFNKVQRIIIDDPYGDFKTNYTVADGNNVTLTLEQFKNILNPSGNSSAKWAHTFKKV